VAEEKTQEQGETQRRKYSRVKAHVVVNVQKFDGFREKISSDKGTIRNLSEGGLLLQVSKPLEIDSHIIVNFSLPGSDEKMDFIAKVVRIEKLPNGQYEAGIMFLRMIMGEFERLKQYVFEEER